VKFERVFWLQAFPTAFVEGCQPFEVRFGFLFIAPAELMIYRAGNAVMLIPGNKQVNTWEMNAPVTFFELNWPSVSGKVKLNRYQVYRSGQWLDIDSYRDRDEGLILLRCAFDTEVQAKQFVMPDGMVGREVTGDDRYTEESLARLGIPK